MLLELYKKNYSIKKRIYFKIFIKKIFYYASLARILIIYLLY
jgi:hypothetical protein